MELDRLFEERRSVRSYADLPVAKEDLLKILEAARLAPSWKNSQTARYYVAASEEMREKLRSECLPVFNQNNSANANVIIVSAFKKGVSGFTPEGEPVNELKDEWGAYDLGLSNAYLILKARDLGYDTLIMGIRDSESIRKLLDIGDDIEIASVISLGKRDKEPVMKARKPMDETVKIF